MWKIYGNWNSTREIGLSPLQGMLAYLLEYGLFIRAISRATVGHSSSRFIGILRLCSCVSSHFMSS